MNTRKQTKHKTNNARETKKALFFLAVYSSNAWLIK